MYTKKVIELFKNPKNVGEIKNADAEATVGNKVCGDQMKMTLKVKNNKIVDIKFKTYGCGAAIATSSMVTELAKGKTLKQAEKLQMTDVMKALGELPPIKMHCAVLAIDALREAIKNYKGKK